MEKTKLLAFLSGCFHMLELISFSQVLWSRYCPLLQVKEKKKSRRQDIRGFPFYRLKKKQKSRCQDIRGFPSGSAGRNLPVMQETRETWVPSLG